MKQILNILFILAFSFCSCQEEKNTKPTSDPPKVAITDYELRKRDLPKLKYIVNDYERIFNIEQLEKLTLKIREFEKRTTNQIAILTIKSIGKYKDFDKFANDLSNYNGIGLKEKNNGLAIVFSKNLRKIRISTGIGTEKILTNEICKKVIDDIIIPRFKDGNYYAGIEKGLEELIRRWR